MGAHGPGSLPGKQGESGDRGVWLTPTLLSLHTLLHPPIDPVGRLISCFIAVRAMEFLNNFALFVYPSGECGRQPGGPHTGAGKGGGSACKRVPHVRKKTRLTPASKTKRTTREWGVM